MRYGTSLFITLCAGVGIFALATSLAIKPIPSLSGIIKETKGAVVTDRSHLPLAVSYQGEWNNADYIPLYAVPESLKNYFIQSEDKRFYTHRGVDWRARFAALLQNIRAGRTIRGASTITEQVVRMIHPRSRSLWSKWIEGFEAHSLEKQADKAEILEFYLNQVPYSANRRGIVQAARYYFDRDLSTLNQHEMIALAILARAPSAYDLYENPKIIERSIASFLDTFPMPQTEKDAILRQRFQLSKPSLPADASHFVRFVRKNNPADTTVLQTTLDASLQKKVQSILDKRLEILRKRNAHNGAVLIADHQTGDILAWVVAGVETSERPDGWMIDAVTTPRQPGSALKPFLYAAALEKGWTAATLIDDSPLSEAIGTGLHRFRNYSRHFYGPLPLRETLGNSLNIPALKTIRHVGVGPYLTLLHDLGFSTLDRSSMIYDEGLALGNAEVTLYDLVQAYNVLANRGIFQPLQVLQNNEHAAGKRHIFSEEAASLIGNILSDPYARRFEFGTNSVLNLPVQTAAKTGTSNDYHDAWAVGYNDRYTVGVWIGNMDRTPMDGITGSTGAALILRAAFSELNRYRETKPLFLSPRLEQREICLQTARDPCIKRTEYFIHGTQAVAASTSRKKISYELVRPTDHLQIAYDPRIPSAVQKFRFELSTLNEGDTVDWILDGKKIASTEERQYLWPLQRGKYKLSVIINNVKKKTALPEISFVVK